MRAGADVRAAARLALVAYLSVPVLHESGDTKPRLFTAASWVLHGDASLDAYPTGLSNEIVVNGHWHSAYPVGLAVVAAPFIAPFVLGGASVLDLTIRHELPTRVHERYLFPALALLAPFAVASRRAVAAYVALSVVLAVAVLFALEPARFDPSALVLMVLIGLVALGWSALSSARRRPRYALTE